MRSAALQRGSRWCGPAQIDVGFGMDLLLNFFTMYIEPGGNPCQLRSTHTCHATHPCHATHSCHRKALADSGVARRVRWSVADVVHQYSPVRRLEGAGRPHRPDCLQGKVARGCNVQHCDNAAGSVATCQLATEYMRRINNATILMQRATYITTMQQAALRRANWQPNTCAAFTMQQY